MNIERFIRLMKIGTAIVLLVMVMSNVNFRAQHNDNGHFDPDLLVEVTISGTTIVDSSTFHLKYYLDEDNNGTVDYHLNFGPIWYSPDSSLAARPVSGDVITVIGGVHDSFNMTEQTIIVYELNGKFWRNPYFAEWNDMGNHNHQMGNHHGGGMFGYGFGWEHDSIVISELNGITIVDTTFYMNKYYLDVDNDSIPDFHLNFGPIWYEAESGAESPKNGDVIAIKGGQINSNNEIPMIIVYEINGLTWRDSSTIGNHFGGGWVHVGLSDSSQFHSPFDHNDRMIIRSGWKNQGGHHGGGMNNFDSLFCQILEIYPENVPNIQDDNIFAGYEIHMFDPNGNSMMRSGGMMGGHMEFGSKVGYQLHYTDKQLEYYNVDENSIGVSYWDDLTNNWISANASINTEANTISYENTAVSNFVVLSYDNATNVTGSNSIISDAFSLEQNYPNPFNPTTTIKYRLNKSGSVSLKVYDVIGREVAAIINQSQQAGFYEISFDGSNLTSGLYFYKLKSGNNIKIRKMLLLK